MPAVERFIMNIKEVIKKDGTKVYRSNVYLGVDSITGKKVKTTITGRTKKEVKAKAQQAQSNFNANGSTVFKATNIRNYKELADLWLENYQMTVKPQTVDVVKSYLTIHILPSFGAMPLENISIVVIQDWVNKLARKLVNFSAVVSVHKRILQYAVTMQLIDYNPAREVILPRKPKAKTKVKYILNDNLKIFMGYMDKIAPYQYKDYYDNILYHLLLATGCRFGEVAALEWSDIDLKNGTVSINKNYSHISNAVSTVKSKAGNRIISIDNKTVLMLKQYRNRQRQIFVEVGAPVPSVVFATPTQTYMQIGNRQHALKTHLKACNIPRFTFHAFRHTHASLLLNAGISYKELQHRLGHANITMTLDIYSHLSKEKEKEAVFYYEKALKNL